MQIELPDEVEMGVFADFASAWHTPATFVLDFLSVKRPPTPAPNKETGEVDHGVLPVKVAARVRIPPEQIFPLINALQEQGDQWLRETGRSEPPRSWGPPPPRNHS